MKRDFGIRDFHYDGANVKADINFGKWEEKHQNAQTILDQQIMQSMEPFMPFVTGNFVQNTKARSAVLAGSGQVCAAAPPYGRYLYEGKVMIESTGQHAFYIPEVGWRHHKGSTLIPTDKDLHFTDTFHPEVRAHWFDAAKERFKDQWIDSVRRQLQ